MKKILFILSFVFAASFVNAQVAFTGTLSNKARTFTNTAADTINVNLNRGTALTTIQSVVTRSSGTMAGKVYLYYSLDGLNYNLCDSASLSNAVTNSNFWTKSISAPNWRVVRNGATTVTGISNARIAAAQ